MSAVSRWLGTLLIVFGISLLGTTAALYGYGMYERYRFEQELATSGLAGQQPGTVAGAELPDVTTPTPDLTATASAASTVATPEIEVTPTGPAPTPSPTVPPATPTPVPTSPPTRIVAPSIELDSPVVEAPIKNNEWQVPKFVAGHLEGTAFPGQGSNVVLSGHVQSISSGNVFANLSKLKMGDHIRVDTKFGSVEYVVREVKTVRNDDLSVVAPTPEERLTLITCTGTWNPVTRDYSHRTIVVAAREPVPTSGGAENRAPPDSPEI